MEDYDYLFKILLIGDSGVGKSSLLVKRVNDEFYDRFLTTIGVDLENFLITVDDKIVKMQVWDTAGQIRFRPIISCYYKGSYGILLMYDVSNRDSFHSLEKWLDDSKKQIKEYTPILLVGNKTDKLRHVQYEEAKEFADEHLLEYIECSVKDNENIIEVFQKLGKIVKDEAVRIGNIERYQKKDDFKVEGKKSRSCCNIFSCW